MEIVDTWYFQKRVNFGGMAVMLYDKASKSPHD